MALPLIAAPFILAAGLIGLSCAGRKERNTDPWIEREGRRRDEPKDKVYDFVDPKRSLNLHLKGYGADGKVTRCSVYSINKLISDPSSSAGNITFDTFARWISFPEIARKNSKIFDSIVIGVKGTIFSNGATDLLLSGKKVYWDPIDEKYREEPQAALILFLHPPLRLEPYECLASYNERSRSFEGLESVSVAPGDHLNFRDVKNGKSFVICSDNCSKVLTSIAAADAKPLRVMPHRLEASIVQEPPKPGTRPDAGPDASDAEAGPVDSGASDTITDAK